MRAIVKSNAVGDWTVKPSEHKKDTVEIDAAATVGGLGMRDRHQQTVWPLRIRCPAVEARIQQVQFVQVQLRYTCGDGKVNLRTGIDGLEVRLIRDGFENYAMGLGLEDDARERKQTRHIIAGFTRQLQRPEILGPSGLAVAGYSPLNPSLSGIVASEG